VEPQAQSIIDALHPLELEAVDNLLGAKVSQAFHTNQHRTATFPYKIGDHALLFTKHRCCEYMSGTGAHVAKFIPHFDGPYKVTHTNKKHSTVMLDLLKQPTLFPVFHTSEL